MRATRRRYMTGLVVTLGGTLTTACALGDAGELPPSPTRSATTVDRPRPARPAPQLAPRERGLLNLSVLYGPWFGPLYTAQPVQVLTRSGGQLLTPDKELHRTTAFATFQERYPGSSITLETFHDPLLRARGLHATGKAPDIFQADDLRAADLIRQGAVHSLDQWVRRWPDASDFARPAWLAGQTNHRQWGLPLLSHIYTLYFNQAELEQTDIRQPPTTWEGLVEVAERSTRVVNGRVMQRGFTVPHSRWFWWLLQMTGATLYEHGQPGFTGGEAELVLSFLKDLYAAVWPPGVGPLRVPGGPWDSSEADWRQGNAVHGWVPSLPPQHPTFEMQHYPKLLSRLIRGSAPASTPAPIEPTPTLGTTTGTQATRRPTPESTLIGVPAVPGNVLYTMPGGRTVRPLVHAQTAVLHLSTQSAHVDEAWELLTLLLAPDTLYDYTSFRFRTAIPSRKSLLSRGYLQSQATQEAANLWLRYGRPPFNPPEYDAVSKAVDQTFQAVVVAKRQTPGKGVTKLADTLEAIAQDANPPYAGTTRT